MQYNKHHRHLTFVVGDKVLLAMSHFSNLPGVSLSAVRKFRARYYGPFEVIQVVSPVAYKLKLPDQLHRVHPVIHISRLKPYVDSGTRYPERHDSPPPLPEEVNGELHYYVTEFRDQRVSRGTTQYLVKFADEEIPIWLPEWLLKEDLSSDAFTRLVDDLNAQVQVVQQRRKK